jgi:hypothetical protein
VAVSADAFHVGWRNGSEGWAGWKLAVVLGRSDMANLIAKQNGGNLTEAEAIGQAKDGDPSACSSFERSALSAANRVFPLGFIA